ncbi:MAG: hypothetical protein ABL889_19540 [Terricaulis sp.]
MQFNRGYLSPYFITNAHKMEANLDDPLVLLYARKLSNLEPPPPLLTTFFESGRAIFIIAVDIDREALATLIVNKLRGSLKVAAIQAPGSGDHQMVILEDIAVFTGGHVIGQDTGIRLENATIDMLGRAASVVVKKGDTTISDGAGTQNDIADRIAQIQSQIENAVLNNDKVKLQERIAKLATGLEQGG